MIKRQRLFFLEGKDYIVPYLQRELAKDLGVSASTVSRLVRSKYFECSHGVFVLKSLCPRNIYGKSATQVRHLVGYYCKHFPSHSDQKIANRLKEIGLPIARRTVTKYRHQIDVSSSYDRKHHR